MTPDSPRARRRRDAGRIKTKYFAVVMQRRGRFGDPVTARDIGVSASTHGKSCSCALCGNRRRFSGPSAAERRAPQMHPDEPWSADQTR